MIREFHQRVHVEEDEEEKKVNPENESRIFGPYVVLLFRAWYMDILYIGIKLDYRGNGPTRVRTWLDRDYIVGEVCTMRQPSFMLEVGVAFKYLLSVVL